MAEILNYNFFERPTLKVARDLLGKFLCRRYRGRIIKAMITEVEAYDGFNDKASHAARGQTERNKIMFGPAGHWYVYFTYGMYWMLNIVTGRRGYPAAVLIRGIAVSHLDSMTRHTDSPRDPLVFINGPARLTKFFKIGKKFNGKPTGRKTGLWIEDREIEIKKSQIKRSSRVGVTYAGPVWSKKPYRFHLRIDAK